MKIRSVGAALLYAERTTDGQTDEMKLKVAFRSYANAPNNMCSKQSPARPSLSLLICQHDCRLTSNPRLNRREDFSDIY